MLLVYHREYVVPYLQRYAIVLFIVYIDIKICIFIRKWHLFSTYAIFLTIYNAKNKLYFYLKDRKDI